MEYVNFRLLSIYDAEGLSNLLLNSPQEYIEYFHPFEFQVVLIQSIIKNCIKDKLFAIEVVSDKLDTGQLVGFYMLRGMDEGYLEPMYGVFISREWQAKGIARLSLYHAECFCKINLYRRILLKVNQNNHNAQKLYESIGYRFLRDESRINNIVLYKDLY
jgi:RimJ/RimL family protein N-acetyltransferase